LQLEELITSINQSVNKFITHHSTEAHNTSRYHRLKRNALSRFLEMVTDGAVRQLSGREFQSLGAATEKRRAAMSMFCGGMERKLLEYKTLSDGFMESVCGDACAMFS